MSTTFQLDTSTSRANPTPAPMKRLTVPAIRGRKTDGVTGEPLVINLDTTSAGLGDKPRLDWLTRQFARIDIQLVVRSTDFSRFQEKLRKGAVQIFYLGWNADYPDPENFYFLLYGSILYKIIT